MNPEKSFLIEHLQASAAAFEKTVRQVSAEDWARPSADSWSMGQCAEHVVILEKMIARLLPAMNELPEEPYDPADSARKDRILLGVAERGPVKVEAPPVALPGEKPRTQAEVLADFAKARAKSFEIVTEFPQWLRGRFREHPFFNKLDGYQWMLVCSCHTQRHTRQMEEIQEQFAANTQ